MASAASRTGNGIGLLLPDIPDSRIRERKKRLVGDKHRRQSTVYENVKDIADEFPRPAIIQDVERSQLDATYEYVCCLANGGSATVWKAIERATGRLVAIKVVDKKLLPASLLNMEVLCMQRCAGHPHIVQLLAAYELAGDDANANGEWHLVIELADGGESGVASRAVPLLLQWWGLTAKDVLPHRRTV